MPPKKQRGSPSDAPAKPTSKRAKSTTSKTTVRRKKKGSLSSVLSNMSVELIFEIFGHLHPLDLIHLSRTTKSFRNILMNSSAKPIWRVARQNVPRLPPLPDDLSEPEYADLMFGNTCHSCGHQPVHKVYYLTRNRWCVSCKQTELLPFFRSLNFHPIKDLIPTEQIQVPVKTLMGSISLPFKILHIPTFSKINKRLEELGSGPKIQEYTAECRRKVVAIKQHAHECDAWEDRKKYVRELELREIKDRRLEEIKRRLLAMGWTTDELGNGYETWHTVPTVCHSKPLTERGWQTLKPKLIARLESIKVEARQNDRRLMMIHSYDLLLEYEQPSTNSYPGLRVVLQFPEIKAACESLDEEVKTLEMINCINHLEDLIKDWRVETTAVFATYLPPFPGTTQDSTFRLNLATSVFRCVKDLTIGHFFSRLLDYFPDMSAYIGIKPYEEQYPFTHIPEYQWPDGWFEFDEMTSAVISQILAACGMDSASTTLEELEELDPRIVCLTCAEKTKTGSIYGPTMTWKRAIHHWREIHVEPTATTYHKNRTTFFNAPPTLAASKWRMLAPEERSNFIDTYEQPALDDSDATIKGIYVCKLCFLRHHEMPALYTPEAHDGHIDKEHADLDLDTYTNDMFRTEHPNAPFSDPPIINYLGHSAS